MDQAGDWRRLCGLLDDDEAVWEAVEAALEAGDDPWEALLDGLDEAGAPAFLRADDDGWSCRTRWRSCRGSSRCSRTSTR